MKGIRGLAAAALAVFLVFSVLGDSSSTLQRPLERRNWTPQAMLYLKGAQGRRFLSDQSRRKELADRPPPERRSPNARLLTLPEAVALLLASLQKPQEGLKEPHEELGDLLESSSDFIVENILTVVMIIPQNKRLLTTKDFLDLLQRVKEQWDGEENLNQKTFMEDGLLNR